MVYPKLFVPLIYQHKIDGVSTKIEFGNNKIHIGTLHHDRNL